jgi:hypothetical protein
VALTASIFGALGHLAELFSRWMEVGKLAADLGSPLDLAYSLMSPVGLAPRSVAARRAEPEVIEAARLRAARHTDLFIKTVFR